jgi:putative ABC transport system ATP-binding protein
MAILEIDRASKIYGAGEVRVAALDEVSLRVEPGEFVAIMGPSGSGKSTLLHLAGALDQPTSGRVLLAGADMASMNAASRAHALRHQIGFVFQNFNLLGSLTAAENVALPLELAGVRPRRARATARGLLESVGLLAAADRFPGQLSGGEQQRVAIARAVVGGRSLLLADEPTGALDSLSGESVMTLLAERRTEGCAVVMVTHDVRHAAWADRVIFLRDGRVVDQATQLGPESLLYPGRA